MALWRTWCTMYRVPGPTDVTEDILNCTEACDDAPSRSDHDHPLRAYQGRH